MSTPPVSVIIVSRGRPDLLCRAILGVSQLDYAPFELIVVACPEGIQAVQNQSLAPHIKTVLFDDPNISAARNLGIDQAAGDIIAFIDDDAVPEPQWLRELVAPFETPEIAATGGYVIARNGLSYQWKARSLSGDGFTSDLELTSDLPVMFDPAEMGAIKTEGTNMALRRDVLEKLGGFDPAFSFYMDESDINMRIAAAGLWTALVPRARVHHGYAASRRRARDRTPLDLSEIGRSTATFIQRYCSEDEWKPVWRAHVSEQRKRCLRAMQRGRLGADDVFRLIGQFRRGISVFKRPLITSHPAITPCATEFRAMPNGENAQKTIIYGYSWQTRSKFSQAQKARRNGVVVHLFLFSPSILYHKRGYRDGIWIQTGGIYGRSHRSEPFFSFTTLKKRVASELEKCDITSGN